MIHSTKHHTAKLVLHHFDCILRIKIMRFEAHRKFRCIYVGEYGGVLALFGKIVLRQYSYNFVYTRASTRAC